MQQSTATARTMPTAESAIAAARANGGRGLHPVNAKPRDLAEVLPAFEHMDSDAPAAGFLVAEGMSGDCAFRPNQVAGIRPDQDGNGHSDVILASGQIMRTRWSVAGVLAAIAAFRDDDSGATLVEYSLITALVAVVAVATIDAVGVQIVGSFTEAATAMQTAITPIP